MQGPPKLLFLRDSVDRGLLQTYCLCVGILPQWGTLRQALYHYRIYLPKKHNTNARNFWPNKNATRPASGPSCVMAETYSKQLPFLLEETFQQNPLRCQRSFQTFYSVFCQPPLENQKPKKKVSGFIFPLNEWSSKSPFKGSSYLWTITPRWKEKFFENAHTRTLNTGGLTGCDPGVQGPIPRRRPFSLGTLGGPLTWIWWSLWVGTPLGRPLCKLRVTLYRT